MYEQHAREDRDALELAAETMSRLAARDVYKRQRQTTIPGVTWEAIMLITVKMHLIPMQLHGIRQVYSTL